MIRSFRYKGRERFFTKGDARKIPADRAPRIERMLDLPEPPTDASRCDLREDVLPALKMTQTEFADLLGVSRVTVSELLLGKRALSAEMAVRIATLLRTTPESWLRMQAAVSLWEVAQEPAKLATVKPLPAKRLAEMEEAAA